VIDAYKTLDFIRTSARNHREVVTLLVEEENECGEMHYINARWLSRGSVLKQFFCVEWDQIIHGK
jgi:hypothetical protein